jgi:hypothetical protein
VVIYNNEECQFLYPEDALSVLYFLKPLEEELLRQIYTASNLAPPRRDGDERQA